jgi:hypothetical protein
MELSCLASQNLLQFSLVHVRMPGLQVIGRDMKGDKF